MKRVSKLIKFPADLVAEIEKYQKENYITSFSGAVYELIRTGLKQSDNRDSK
jgi:metal-responsive CopG/Arc/MetJ family transcriptional regulator